jgi:hypothetical protein
MQVGGPLLRTLDAIHIATAVSIRAELGVLLTYDRRMVTEAEALRLPVLTSSRRWRSMPSSVRSVSEST